MYFPKPDTVVLCLDGKGRTFVGRYVHRWTEESDQECVCGEEEYSEEHDAYYYVEGWYEQTLFSDDYSWILISGTEVTKWKPIGGMW